MKFYVKRGGLEAVATESGWEADIPLFRELLETTAGPQRLTGYNPSVAAAMANMAVEKLGVEIVRIEGEPEYTEGVIY